MTPTTPAATTAPGHMTATEWARWALPGVVWGTSFFFIAVGLESFPPATITPIRIGLGFLTLACFRAARKAEIPRPDLWRIRLLGLVWMAIPLSLFPFAEQHVSSSVTGMLNGATPIFVTAVAAVMAHQLPPRTRMIGLGVGMVGVVLIALPAAGEGSSSLWGIALIVLALVFYGFALNMAVPLQQRYGSLPVLWRAQGTAFVLTIPFGLLVADRIEFAWRPFLAMVCLGVFGTALAYVAMADNAGRLGSSRASASVYLIPVVSLALGSVIRNEDVALLSVIGCAVTLVGAWLTSRR